MINQDKVLHGLNSCGFYDGIPNICGITECPYREHGAYCVHELAHDAGVFINELLKEREPRKLTSAEWKQWKRTDPNKKDPLFCQNRVGESVWISPHDVREINKIDDIYYGGLHIVWTSKPTKEQMQTAFQ